MSPLRTMTRSTSPVALPFAHSGSPSASPALAASRSRDIVDPSNNVITSSMPPDSTLPDITEDDIRGFTIEEKGSPDKGTNEDQPEIHSPRPETPQRSITESPSAAAPLIQLHFESQQQQPARPRNRSPFSRSHLRSRSTSNTLSAPPMTRAHSLPSVISPAAMHASPGLISPRSSSPLRSPARVRSPYRAMAEDTFPQSNLPPTSDPSSLLDLYPKDITAIHEDEELDLTPKPDRAAQGSPVLGIVHGNTFPRRRRPVSPLHHVANAPFGTSSSTPTSSSASSPMLSATKFNEPFPSTLTIHYPSSFSSSSVPSTPTSTRSRSPSISSLETIPDTPDAEAEAIEADRIARLKAAAEAAERREKGEDDASEGTRRGSLDVPGRRPGLGMRDKRKRWSVCGAERRQDLDLETIWED